MFSQFVNSQLSRKFSVLVPLCLLGLTATVVKFSFAGTSDLTSVPSILKLRKTAFTSIQAYGTEIMIVNKSVDLRNSIREADHRSMLGIQSQLTEDSWMARGPEQRGERLQIAPLDAKQKLHLISHTDGTKAQVWNWGAPTVQEHDDDSVVQSLSGWLQIESHANAISPELDPLIAGTAKSLGDEKLGNVETRKFELKVDDEIHTWWIAPQFGSVIVKYERRNAAPQKSISTVSWEIITVVDKVEQIGGMWMPTLARRFNLVNMDNGKTFWEIWTRASISQVKINLPPPSPYEIQVPLQTYVPHKDNLDMKPVGGDIRDELPRFASYAELADLPAEDFSQSPLSQQTVTGRSPE